MRSRVWLTALLLAAPAAPAWAQNEQPIPAEVRREVRHIKEDCGSITFAKIPGCAMTIATDHPLHLAFGSIAPQNGFGLGAAFSHEMAPVGDWRNSLDTDAVAAGGGAWRAGAYLKLRHTVVAAPRPVTPGAGSSRAPLDVYPIYSVYAQAISLPTVAFYGGGNDSVKGDRTLFAFKESILGASAVVPIDKDPMVNLALVGEVNGRFVSVNPSTSSDSPTIGDRFGEFDAPGLTSQPGVFQLGEGVRLNPTLVNGHLTLDYLAQFQEFLASSATDRFERLTIDLNHTVPLGSTSRPDTSGALGPDQCTQSGTDSRCAPMAPIRTNGVWNRSGALTFRFYFTRSFVGSTASVPFYFQPTLGGSDLNGVRALPSFDDYRFRGPHAVLFQQTFEHVIAGPVGAFLGFDEGRVSDQAQGLQFSKLKHSVIVGATIRAGAFPLVQISLATGGGEGHHAVFAISTSLLGGGSRPSLF